jgi:predicted Zn-dependent protease
MRALLLLLCLVALGFGPAGFAPLVTAAYAQDTPQSSPPQASPPQASPPHAPAPPVPAGGPAAMRRQLTGQLLDALQQATDETAAAALEGRIRALWLNAGTPAVSLLVSRCVRELAANAPGDALDDINAALDLQPDLAAGWTLRASAEFDTGHADGAVKDLEEAVRLEPRQFDAFQTLSRIAEQRGDWKGAYAAWVRLMQIDPRTPGGGERLRDLQRRALGDEL